MRINKRKVNALWSPEFFKKRMADETEMMKNELSWANNKWFELILNISSKAKIVNPPWIASMLKR